MKGKSYLVLITLAVAFGGFLFGFDAALISGAKQPMQVFWQLSESGIGWAMAIGFVGTVVGALFGFAPADFFVRKITLFWTGVLCFVSGMASSIAPDVNSFMIFRFIGGVGVGVCCFTAPKYIAEISPADMKWRLIALFQFNIIFGVLAAYIIIYMLTDMRDNGWKWMLRVEAVLPLIYSGLVMMVPKSPRWLIVKKGAVAEAKSILTRIDPTMVDSTIAAIQASCIKGSNSIKSK